MTGRANHRWNGFENFVFKNFGFETRISKGKMGLKKKKNGFEILIGERFRRGENGFWLEPCNDVIFICWLVRKWPKFMTSHDRSELVGKITLWWQLMTCWLVGQKCQNLNDVIITQRPKETTKILSYNKSFEFYTSDSMHRNLDENIFEILLVYVTNRKNSKMFFSRKKYIRSNTTLVRSNHQNLKWMDSN